jgi:cytochrome c-type biogenesis protein CcsB
MPINASAGDLSNGLLLGTVILYALAMLCYASDFAFARHRVMAGLTDEAVAKATVPELVAVGSGGSTGTATVTPAPVLAAASAPASRWPSGFWLRLAFGLTCVGLTAHVVAILTRGLAEHRTPWGNMYEFIAAFTCMAVLVLVVASVWNRAYYMGLFVMIPIVFGLGIDLTVLYTPAGSLVPALQSYWIAIHVTAMIVAIGLFIFGAVVTTLYLLADRSQRRVAAGRASWAAGILRHVPGPAVLDRLSYRTVLFGFPVWTFGVMAGAIWADHAWGRYWGWDPKETWSFITWVVYAMFLHARATGGWRGRRAGYIQLIGFGCLLFNVIGVNLWVSGLHSYAGMG